MRLLEYSDAGIKLTTFQDRDIPSYAILSHTWGPDSEEVTFKDLIDGTGEKKTGYKKIRFCAAQAKRDSLRYFWIDTCCIDKSNNTELSMAINSMFRWYKNATQCYVYLSDVDGGRPESEWEATFRASKWFTRGWTLQELLAPSSVEFFTKEGCRIGDKRSLEKQIHEITGIAVAALRGDDLAQFDIEERFRWADTRQTTHEEDWAYCLLGIFEIFMPLIYGEGKAHAVRRLRKEIVEAMNSNDKLSYQGGHLINRKLSQLSSAFFRPGNQDLLGHADIACTERPEIPRQPFATIPFSHDHQLGREIRSMLTEHRVQLAELTEVVRQNSTSSQDLIMDLKLDLSINRTTQSRRESSFGLRSTGVNREVDCNTTHRPVSPDLSLRQSRVETERSKIRETKTSFTMEARNMRDIVYPLMSLMPSLLEILPHLAYGGGMDLTETDAAWLKDEFEKLLESAHLSCTDRHVEPIECVQSWHSMDENVMLGPMRKRKAADEAEDETVMPKKRYNHPACSRLVNSHTYKHNSRRYETPMGSLLVQTELQQRKNALVVCVSFTPDDHILREYRTGFATIFRRYPYQQSIERCLTIFRIVEREGSAFETIANGDLGGLQALLSKRAAFPTDRLLENGNTLISYASREVQLPICDFLLTSVEGIDPCEADSEGMNAIRLMVQGFQDEEISITEVSKQDERQGFISKLVERGCLEDESCTEREAEDGCLHLSGFREQPAYPADELLGMVSTFIRSGAGLEIRDRFGKTPLLDNLSIPGKPGLEIIDKLLKSGADIKAVDNVGNGVFHLVLELYQNTPDDLRKRLRLLIEYSSRSDLSRTNEQGYTPSDFALTPELWPIWCQTTREKIPLATLLEWDPASKLDWKNSMSRPKKPALPKRAPKLDLIGAHRRDTTTPTLTSRESDVHHETPSWQCWCSFSSSQFVRWVARDAPGQDLPGLPRCLTCCGYILPDEMEHRKRWLERLLTNQGLKGSNLD